MRSKGFVSRAVVVLVILAPMAFNAQRLGAALTPDLEHHVCPRPGNIIDKFSRLKA